MARVGYFAHLTTIIRCCADRRVNVTLPILHRLWPPLDRAGTADPGQPDPDPVLGPLRAAVDGADAI